MTELDVIKEGLARFGVLADAAKLCAYLDLVLEKNKVMNLTAIKEPCAAAERHIVDSIALLSFGIIKKGDRLLDIGSGAGFPAAPLAICGGFTVTALDSVQKKLRFVSEAAASLGIKNLATLSGRAEEIAHGDLREKYDVVTARGFAKLPVLVEYCLPFVKQGGCLLAMKGENVDEELSLAGSAIEKLGGGAPTVLNYTLCDRQSEGEMLTHSVICIKKITRTSTKYPRKQGSILKSSL